MQTVSSILNAANTRTPEIDRQLEMIGEALSSVSAMRIVARHQVAMDGLLSGLIEENAALLKATEKEPGVGEAMCQKTKESDRVREGFQKDTGALEQQAPMKVQSIARELLYALKRFEGRPEAIKLKGILQNGERGILLEPPVPYRDALLALAFTPKGFTVFTSSDEGRHFKQPNWFSRPGLETACKALAGARFRADSVESQLKLCLTVLSQD